jgi:heterotetrameric sarcosine oxidase delta subunit
MLRIPCPYCGARDEPEFVFGGPAHKTRPGLEVDDATWTAYLFNRKNPAGIHLERWLHAYGCGRWFNMARDTRTHRILKTYLMGEPPPEFPG